MGDNKTLRLNDGEWRIATATVLDTTYDFRIVGNGPESTRLYINTPAAVGLTFGTTAADNYYLHLKDFSVVGPAASCTYGIDIIRTTDVRIDNVNFYLGATDYALRMRGCLWITTRRLMAQRGGTGWGDYVVQANGVYVSNLTGVGSGINMADMHVLMSGKTGMANGLYIDSANLGSADPTNFSTVVKVTGSIENCTGYPLYATRINNLNIRDMYMTDVNPNYGPYIYNCRNVTIDGLYANAYATSQVTTLDKVLGATINRSWMSNLTITNDCRGVHIVNSELYNTNSLTDNAPDTVISDLRYRTGMTGHLYTGGKSSDRRNLINNSLFNRWTATYPDGGWNDTATNTWTLCGTGEADTTNRGTTYCALLTTVGGNTAVTYTVDATTLKQILGKFANFTVWQKIAAAQTFASYPFFQFNVTAPTWAVGTGYVIGDAVFSTAGHTAYMYVCKVAGTSHAADEPAWPDVVGTSVDDNGITWVCYGRAIQSKTAQPSVAGDIGLWKRVSMGHYVPKNATAVTIGAYLYQQNVGAPDEATMYLSEPTLMVGWEGPDSVVPGQNEHEAYIQVGSRKLWAGTPTAGVWIEVGDINLSTGQRCTVAGAMGTATWANFP
jgi:hypothetical protein